MRSDRIAFAVETGALRVPDTGRIVFLGPAVPQDLSALPRDRVQVVTRQKPDHDAMLGAGYEVAQAATPGAALAIVCVPRARAAAEALIAEGVACLAPGGVLAIDGQKTDGIDSILKSVRARTPLGEPVVKAHGRMVMLTALPDVADWTARPHEIEGGYITWPGVFSADAPDPASVMLAAALPEKLGSRVVDLGAGWGYLSRAILTRDSVQRLDLVESDGNALDCARRNVTDPRAHFHWADALTFQPQIPAHSVVCNPPFHTGRTADPMLGVAFIRAAQKMLTPDGSLWLVANRHLPYDPVLAAAFREVTEVAGTNAFRVLRAARPQRPAKAK